ncbi:MAG: DUF2141 domain-containing protein [Cyclobacteriaceae bacterium]
MRSILIIALIIALFNLPIAFSQAFGNGNLIETKIEKKVSNEHLVDLVIKLDDLRSRKGKVLAAIFNQEDGFPDDNEKAAYTGMFDFSNTTDEIIIAGIPKGVYGIVLLHDENNNGIMDRNFIGIPSEGYGLSNNPGKKLRPPKYSEVKLELQDSNRVIRISMLYP